MPYLEGRTNSIWIVPPVLPASVVPFVLLVVSCFVLLSAWIRSVMARRNAVAAGLMFLVGLLFLGASFKVRSGDLFRRGFNDYAKNALTADEWRGISRFAQEHLPADGRLPGPDKNLWSEKDHRVLWSALAAETQVQKLDPSLMIFVRPEQTEIVWGGALVGHRAIIISTRRNGGAQRDKSSTDLPIAEDIFTSAGPN
jgi:hypothetical protein